MWAEHQESVRTGLQHPDSWGPSAGILAVRGMRAVDSGLGAAVALLIGLGLTAYWPSPYALWLLYLFFLFRAVGSLSPGTVLTAASLVVFLFFTRAHMGALACALYALAFLFHFLEERPPRWALSLTGLLAVPALGMVLAAFPLRVNLTGYLVGSLQLAAGYGSAMAMPPAEAEDPCRAVVIILAYLCFAAASS